MANLWSGRFSTEPDPTAFEFGSSFRFDKRLFEDDVTGSLAWVEGLTGVGVFNAAEAKTVSNALQHILENGRRDPSFVSGADAGRVRAVWMSTCALAPTPPGSVVTVVPPGACWVAFPARTSY